MRAQLKKRVVIVEDVRDIRDSYKIIINSSKDFEVVGVYSNCEDFLQDISKKLPDIVIMDIGLPGINGVEGTLIIKKMLPYIDVIIVSVYKDSEYIFEALKNGATGYISKSSNYTELLNALDEIVKGGAPMSSKIARMVIGEFQTTVHSPLGKRETEVLELISKGKSYTQIADELVISKETVKTHTKNIYRKLHATKKSQAISIALEKRIISR